MASRKSWVKQALKNVRAAGAPRKAQPKRLGFVQLEDRSVPAIWSNPAAITIPSSGNGSIYPSTIAVSGEPTVTDINVSLTGLSHTWPDDVDILLVGPTGVGVRLMESVGGAVGISGTNITLDDSAASSMPDSALITSGTYKATVGVALDSSNAPPVNYPAPAPAGPYNLTLSAFNGTNPNGTWSLYVFDDTAGDAGSIAGGWSINVNNTSATPPNDNFASAIVVPSLQTATVTGTNVAATVEVGEPTTFPAASSPYNTVWWNWTAPISGPVEVNTLGSTFDTTLGVYTGAAVNALTLVGSNDDALGYGTLSKVSFAATAGTTYRFQVDGFGAATGAITLNVLEANDSFARAFTMPGTNISAATGSNVGATGETGEPNNAGLSAPIQSNWWNWTAPATRNYEINTKGSGFDTTLGVYTGAAVNALTLVGSNDDFYGVQSKVTFAGVAGTTYRISVDGFSSNTGNIVLNVVAFPPTVVYVDPTFTVVGTPVDGDNTTAGVQAAEVGYDAFTTISAAYAALDPAGGTIIVNGVGPTSIPNGPYATNLDITKPVQVLGKSLPTVGSLVNSPTTAAGDVFRVLTNGVTIDGLKVGGPGTRRGVTNVQSDGTTLVPVSNTTVTNNTFVGTGGAAVRFNSNGTATTGLLVQNNNISNFGAADPTAEGYGVQLVGDTYGTVTGNVVTVPDFTTDLFVGVYAFNYAGTGTLDITNNTVYVGKVGAGIYLQTLGSAGQTVNVTGNTVQGAAGTASGDDAWGIDTLYTLGGGTVNIASNSVGGGAGFLDYGVVLEDSAGVTVGLGNTVAGGKVGLKVSGSTTLVGNTIADIQFTGQTSQHIVLDGGAAAGVEINGTGATFNGLTGGTATLAQNFGIEDKITHATDNDSLGFVRVRANVVYVTELSDSVARGAKVLQAGNTLKAQSGTYNEPYPIEVKVNALVDGEGKATTVVTPAFNDPSTPAGDLFRVLADNVTVQEFTFDGLGKARRGLTNYSGTGPAATPVNNLVVQNNAFTGYGERAVSVTNTGTAAVTTGLLVSNNSFADYGQLVDADGVFLAVDVGGTVTGNTFSIPGTGVNSGVYVTTYTAANLTVSANNLTVGAGGVGVFVEDVSGGTISVAGNTVNAEAGLVAANDAWGIDVITSPVGVSVSNNTLGGSGGYLLFGVVVDVGAIVPVTGNDYLAKTHIGLKVAGSAVATLSGEAFAGGRIGIQVEDGGTKLGGDTLGDTTFTALTLQDVVLANGAYAGAYIDGAAATYDGVLGGAGVTLAQSFGIEDMITHATDDDTVGYVVFKPGTVATTDASNSIARAAKVTKAGETIDVQAGLYDEPYAITLDDAGVTVAGPGAALAKSQPEPGFNDPFTSAGDMIRVLADDLTIDGVTFDGLGQLRRGLTNYSGTGPAATPVQNLVVTNNVFQNFAGRGISVTNAGNPVGTTSTVTISGNTLSNFGAGADDSGELYGIFAAQDTHGSIFLNTIDVVDGPFLISEGFQSTNSGIFIYDYAGGTGQSLDVFSNTITVGKEGTGIQVYGVTGGTQQINVSSNTIDAAAGVTAADDTWGIAVYEVYVPGVSVSGNVIGSTSAGTFTNGIGLFNVGDKNVTPTGGTIENSQNGVQVYGVEPFDEYDASAQTVSVDSVVITTIAGGFGVVANDNSAPGSPTKVYVENATLTQNLKGLGTGAAVDGQDAYLYLTKQDVAAATPLGGTNGFYLQVDDSVLSGAGPSTVGFSGPGSKFQITPNTVGAVVDTFAIPGTSVQYNTSSTVNFNNLSQLDVYGLDGNDYFSVSPNITAAKTVINVFGGNPQLVTPGDTLDLNLVALIGDPSLTVPSPGLPDGSVTAATAGNVNWTSIETLPIPLGLGGSFDFNKETYVPTAPEFRGVIPSDSFVSGKYSGAAGYLASSGYSYMGGFDRKDLGQTPNVPSQWQDLYRDGHWGYDGDFGQVTFRVAVSTAQAVQVTLSVGDTYFIRDYVDIYAGDPAFPGKQQKLGTVNTKTGEFGVLQVTLNDPTLYGYDDNFLDLTIRDSFGYSYWTWNYLDVRPVTLVNDLILSPAAPANVPADGKTVTNYTGTGARPNGLVTISSTYGTVLNDVAPAIGGVQIQADATGNFSFDIQSPTSATALTGAQAGTISASEVTGFGKTKAAITQGYDAATAGGVDTRFDFNGPTGGTQAGFTGVRAGDIYNPALGYGWQVNPLEFERTAGEAAAKGATNTDLYADGAWSRGSAPGKFLVSVTKGASVNARAYIGDSYNRWIGTTFQVEGGGAPVTIDLSTKNYAISELSGSDADGDGVFWVQVGNIYAGRIWAITGLDIAEGGLPAALPQRSAVTATAPVKQTLTAAELAPIVDAAIARWVQAGITAEQEAKLRAAVFSIGDLDAVGRLGEAGFGRITIDDNANGQGWFVDQTPNADEEFVNGRANRRAAIGKMDLLTVVQHELGHVLGWDSISNETYPNHIMAEVLGAGTRRGSSTADLSQFFAPYVDGTAAPAVQSVAASSLASKPAVAAVAVDFDVPLKKAKAKASAVSLDDPALAPWVG